MKIQFLGTAAAEGIPALFCNCEICAEARRLGGKEIRTRSQALVDDHLLIDFPPDSYAHMLKLGVDLPHIHSLLITHTHSDHFYLEDLMLRNKYFANHMDAELTLYGNDALNSLFRKHMDSDERVELYAGRLACKELTEFKPHDIEGYQVTPLLANHNKKEKCFIYLIEKEGKTILFGNDTGRFYEETWACIQSSLNGKPLSLVSLDCTTLRKADGNNHMGLVDVVWVKNRLLELNCADENTCFIVTHFSHNGKMLHYEIEEALQDEGFLVAYDGFTREF